VQHHPLLSRVLHADEYDQIKTELENLGFYKGWVQELESSNHYRPDFESDKPFG
jgi:hypothetical protein